MIETLVQHGIQYGVYLAEVGLFLYLVLWGHCKRLAGVSLYVAGLLTIVAIARPRVLALYGFTSPQYFYFFYVTDAILALSAFLLVCSFFRRASVERREMWQSLRLVLVSVFIIVVGISCVSLKMNYTNLFGRFTTEFEQNLYFTCLVLNTVLYILIQHVQVADDELELLVCGLGIQFAGTAANFATLGLASDTGDSIRGPAAHQALVGLRSTMGRVSRSGVVPHRRRSSRTSATSKSATSSSTSITASVRSSG